MRHGFVEIVGEPYERVCAAARLSEHLADVREYDTRRSTPTEMGRHMYDKRYTLDILVREKGPRGR